VGFIVENYEKLMLVWALLRKEEMMKDIKKGAAEKLMWCAILLCVTVVFIIVDMTISEYLDGFMKYRAYVTATWIVLGGISIYLFCRGAWEETSDKPKERADLVKELKNIGFYLLVFSLVIFIPIMLIIFFFT